MIKVLHRVQQARKSHQASSPGAHHDVTGRAVVDDDREHRLFLTARKARRLDSCEILSERREAALRGILPGTHAVGIGTLLFGSLPEKGLREVAFDHVF